MTNYNTLGNKFKVNLLNFSKNISQNLGKPAQKFVAGMLFGIIAAKSSKLTDIGRALKEPIALKKTVERLGRNLSEFSDGEALMQKYLSAVKPLLGADFVILVDAGDATKACSPKMEAIGTVKDGSTGKFANGYWTMGAVALSEENHQPIPVYENLYPCKKQGGLGFNAETAKCLQHLRENFENHIPRVFDRGFDAGEILTELVGHNEKFILRANQNRVAVHNGQRGHINEIARGLVCENEIVYQSKSGKALKCKIGMTQIVLPKLRNLKLNLVVCKSFDGDPLVLYTNLDETLENIAVRVVKGYLMRWRIEEFYAFKKENGLRFEDFRVRSLKAIKNLDLLLTIAAGFVGMLCGKTDTSIVVELIAASKRIPKISTFLKKTKFLLYAVLDGIACVVAALRCGIAHYFAPKSRNYQLCFADFEKMG